MFWEIQGIFPKRQNDIAEKLGVIVAEELLSFDDIKERFKELEDIDSIKRIIETKMDDFLENEVPQSAPLIYLMVGNKTKDKIKTYVLAEVEKTIPDVIAHYIQKVESNIDIRQLVYDKVANFSSEKLESIVFAILKKEFKFIEIIGAILGFIIGLIQVGIVLLQS